MQFIMKFLAIAAVAAAFALITTALDEWLALASSLQFALELVLLLLFLWACQALGLARHRKD